MLDRPRFYPALALALLAGAMIEGARHADANGLQTLWKFIAVVLIMASLVNGLNWLLWILAARYRQFREALAQTEKVKVIQEVSKLNDAQIRLLESGTGVIEVMAGSPNPTYVLRVGGSAIPFDFIEQFLSLDDGDYLCPVSTWTEGSKRREWARLLTNHLVLMGFATLHNGNKAAQWVDRDGALRWMGMG